MKKRILLVCLAWVAAVVSADGFEDGQSVKVMARNLPADRWSPLPFSEANKVGKGFKPEADGQTILCDNGGSMKEQRGASWGIMLNQRSSAPVIVAAEALAEKAEGKWNSDFSLYLDLTFMDKSVAYGYVAPFSTQAGAGWQSREVSVFPPKPIKSISCNVLFRKHSGRAKFRNVRWARLTGEAEQFDGLAFFDAKKIKAPRFLVRDVAAGSDFVAIQEHALGLSLKVARAPLPGGEETLEATLTDMTGRDRAVTLAYVIPLGPGELTWFSDPRHAQLLTAHSPEASQTITPHPVGAGPLSRYPLGAVGLAGKGIALGLDMASPAYFRIVCNAAARELFIAFDLGLAPERNSARVRFCAYRFAAAEGFRGALAAYMKLFPEAFRVRIREQGLWMPFTDISNVKGFEDFGFRFKEGDSEPAWDDAHRILTFRYTEPMTWWMPMKHAASLQEAEAAARRYAEKGDRIGKAWLSSAFQNEAGEIPGRIRNEPWCNGVVWSLNSAPGIAGELNHFAYARNTEADLAKRFAAAPPEGVDGEYIDSTTGWVTDPMDFRRGHFAGMKTPLCFMRENCKVGIYKGMISFEYIHTLAASLHPRGRYTMGNGTPSIWCWLAPDLDVLGTETGWIRKGEWHPPTDDELIFRRALSGAKPYCFLMNTDFSKLSHGWCERYMKRCLAYGMFPGFFSAEASSSRGAYFTRPGLYERDRPLFKKYLPIIKRVAEAGWEPVTGYVPDNSSVIIERFGNRYLTVYNLTERKQAVSLRRRSGAASFQTRELVTGAVFNWVDGTLARELEGEAVLALELPEMMGKEGK